MRFDSVLSGLRRILIELLASVRRVVDCTRARWPSAARRVRLDPDMLTLTNGCPLRRLTTYTVGPGMNFGVPRRSAAEEKTGRRSPPDVACRSAAARTSRRVGLLASDGGVPCQDFGHRVAGAGERRATKAAIRSPVVAATRACEPSSPVSPRPSGDM